MDGDCPGCKAPEADCLACPARDDWPDEPDDRGLGRPLVKRWD
jgi:hypothetical protein